MASIEDEKFKVYLGMHVARFGGGGEKLFKSGALPSVKHNNSLRRQILTNMQRITYRGSDGNVIENAASVLWDSAAHDAVIIRITKGLFFYHYKVPMKRSVVIRPYWFKAPISDDKLYTGSIANGDFVYHFNKMDVSDDSMWLYQFFGGHFAGAIVRDIVSGQ